MLSDREKYIAKKLWSGEYDDMTIKEFREQMEKEYPEAKVTKDQAIEIRGIGMNWHRGDFR